MISPSISIAGDALQYHYAQFNEAVARISDPSGTAGFADIMQMKNARQAITVNAAVIDTANDMVQRSIDLLV